MAYCRLYNLPTDRRTSRYGHMDQDGSRQHAVRGPQVSQTLCSVQGDKYSADLVISGSSCLV